MKRLIIAYAEYLFQSAWRRQVSTAVGSPVRPQVLTPGLIERKRRGREKPASGGCGRPVAEPLTPVSPKD